MSTYDTVANFNATDGISSVAQGIGNSVMSMASDVLGNLGDITDGMGLASEAALGLASVGIGALVGAAVVGVSQMDAMNKSMAGVKARTGDSADEMKKLKQSSEDLFNTGLVDNFDEAARTIEAMSHNAALVGENAKGWKDFATDAQAVGDAFGQTGADVVQAVTKIGQIIPSLGDKPMQTLDMLTTMAQKTGLPLKQIEDDITKWGPKFTEAGVSATGMAGLITAAVQAGLGDKGITALTKGIDTFHDHVINPGPGFDAALKKLGLGDVATDLATNKITMDTALSEVFTSLSKIDDPAQRAAAATQLFGANFGAIAGGANGQATLKMLADGSTGFKTMQGAADGVASDLKDDGTLGTALKMAGNNFKTWLGDKAQEAYDRIKSIDWGTISASITQISLWISIQWGLTWAYIEGRLTAAWDFVVNAVNGAVGRVKAAFQAIADAITGPLNGVIDIINSIIDKINQLAGSGIPGIPHIGGSGGGGTGKAHGGTLQKGWTMVGERGPEMIFSPDAHAGTVIPNHEAFSPSMAGAGGGGDVNIYFSGTLVGSGGMDEFAQKLYPYTQKEDQRRGKRQ